MTSPSNGKAILTGCQTNAWPLDPSDPRTLTAALKAIKNLEFDGYETGFRFLLPQLYRTEEFRKTLEDTGLQMFGVHIFLESYDPDTGVAPADLIDRVADLAGRLGARWLVMSGRSASADRSLDTAALRRKVDALNKAGEYCAGRKLGLAYHNHHQEFLLQGAEMEQLLALTEPGAVWFLPDAGHAFRAQVDFARFFRQHHARICAVHLRDFRKDDQVPLGQGEFNLQPLAREVRETRWHGWLFAEEERLSGVKLGAAVAGPARQHIRQVFDI